MSSSTSSRPPPKVIVARVRFLALVARSVSERSRFAAATSAARLESWRAAAVRLARVESMFATAWLTRSDSGKSAWRSALSVAPRSSRVMPAASAAIEERSSVTA